MKTQHLQRTVRRYQRGASHLLRRMARTRRPGWRRERDSLPWLDLPGAQRAIAQRPLSDEDRAILRHWHAHGWVVADGLLPTDLVDQLNDDIDGIWTATEPSPGLRVLGVITDDHKADIEHRDLVTLEEGERDRMREASSWRIHGFHDYSAAAREMFESPNLARIPELILDAPVRPIASINFLRGSQQKLHQDMAVFHIFPRNRLVGAWIALEDIEEHSGPLAFYDGSHRSEMFSEFTDYPQTNLRTADDARYGRYHDWVARSATGYPRQEFVARKGQVFFWHGMLFHGGSAILDPETTRRSMVIHFAIPSADRDIEIKGPFRW